MAITFADRLVNLSHLYFYDASAGTYTARGTADNIYNVDLFPDDATVDDCLIFYGINEKGKYNELALNLDVALAATSITGVWEYISGGTVTAPTWTALSGVTDGTNSFQNTGANTVTFTIPTDWLNFYNPGNTTQFYHWNIRFRITAISGITEGGHLTNTSNTTQTRPYSIYVSGYGSGSPATFTNIYDADVAGGWGVVTKCENNFCIECNLSFDDNNYTTTQQESIQFGNNWFMISTNSNNNSVMLCGALISGDKSRKGSSFFFVGTQVSYPASYDAFGASSKVYSTQLRHIINSGTANFNGYWGAGIGRNSSQEVYDCTFEGLRQVFFNNVNNTIIGAIMPGISTSADSHCEPMGAIIKSCKWFGGSIGLRSNESTQKIYAHECDLSGCTYPVNPYQMQSVNDKQVRIVDCNTGVVTDANTFRWNISATVTYANSKGYKTSSCVIRALDKNGTAISGATLTIKDNTDTTVLTLTSNADGYFTEDAGTITSISGNVITDSSKSWTTNVYRYKEFLITSGSAVGTRRIMNANTGTTLTGGWAFETSPTTNDRFIIVPYLDTKLYVPVAYTPGTAQSSTATDYNPFTFEIRKSGYKAIKKKVTISSKVDWTITLEKVLNVNISNQAKIFNQ